MRVVITFEHIFCHVYEKSSVSQGCTFVDMAVLWAILAPKPTEMWVTQGRYWVFHFVEMEPILDQTGERRPRTGMPVGSLFKVSPQVLDNRSSEGQFENNKL